MKYGNDQMIREALGSTTEIPECVIDRVQETYRELGLVNSEQPSIAVFENAKKQTRKRPQMVKYLAAAACAILAGGTVYAIQMSPLTGLAEHFRERAGSLETMKADPSENALSDDFREILGGTVENYKNKAERYDTMAKESVKDAEVHSLETMIGNSVIREESYYDGSDFALVVSLDSVHYPVEYGFGPENAEFDNLWCPELATIEAIKAQMEDTSLPAELRESFREQYETREKHIAEEIRSIDETLLQLVQENLISEEELAVLKAEYEEKGSVGFICTELFLGDHVLTDDGIDLTALSQMDETGRYLIEPMEGVTPENVWGRDALDVVLQVKKGKRYVYIDGKGLLYLYCPPAEVELVTITLEK